MVTPATTPSGTTAPTCFSAGRAKPASVNLTLAAVDHFYRFTGLGPANTRREQLPRRPPGALDADQTRRLLRAAERTATDPGGIRDRAIACVLLFTGLRIAELVALDSYAGSPAGLAHSGVRSRCSVVGKLLLLLAPAF